MAAKQSISTSISFSTRPALSKPTPTKRKAIFGADEESGDDGATTTAINREADDAIEEWSETCIEPTADEPAKKPRPKKGPPALLQSTKGKGSAPLILGDLSSSLESRKHATVAQELNSTVYEYDDVYDSLKLSKTKKTTEPEDVERQSRYMRSVIAAAAVRKRDALIAEEKKIAREREAEGDEFKDKEKFVTEAYRKQQEENRRLEAEERQKEELEAKKHKLGGMTAFYKDMLGRGEERHAEAVRAAEEQSRMRGKGEANDTAEVKGKEKTEADVAREINEMGGSVVLNEDGDVVDKRQLLKGGLNVASSRKPGFGPDSNQQSGGGLREQNRDRKRGFGGGTGSKQAARQRQSRMLEDQLEQQVLKRSSLAEEEREAIERAAKSRRTEAKVEGARERYLRRKEEAKNKGVPS